MVGKPNQNISAAPLHPIPTFEEPFCRILIDCVGSLPKTKHGNQHILTIMCASTRFLEEFLLRNEFAGKITKTLLNFFSMIGLPKVVQSDQGSNFMSRMFQQALGTLGIKIVRSSAYHPPIPRSLGALPLRQWFRHIVSPIKKIGTRASRSCCLQQETPREPLEFSPFELVFGHSVRVPYQS